MNAPTACHNGLYATNLASLPELCRDVMGKHQEIDLNETEEKFLEELKVLAGRIDLLARCSSELEGSSELG